MGPYVPSILPIVVIDDEPSVVQALETVLAQNGFEHVITTTRANELFAILRREEVGVVLLDLRMPDISGEALLSQSVAAFPEVPVIVVTGTSDVDVAVDCMQRGAFDFITKPIEPRRLIPSVRRAIELRELRREFTAIAQGLLYGEIQNPEAFSGIVTNNPTMLRLLHYAEIIAKTPKPVLITGETGTGKELLARGIHKASGRAGKFVAINVSGLEDHAFSDTLFGHTRGAYTGADEARSGLIERAQNGTLFLDEIGDLAPPSQLKLLRLIEEHEYYPLGSDFPKQTNARFIVATNRDLNTLQETGAFRKDLYYRLQTHEIHLPPLRERLDDLALLLDHFLKKAAETLGKTLPESSPQVLRVLESYDFPGNVRELEAMAFDAVSRHENGPLTVDFFRRRKSSSFPQTVPEAPKEVPQEANPFARWDNLPTLQELKGLLIREALRRANNNHSIAARILGISRPTLISHVKADRRTGRTLSGSTHLRGLFTGESKPNGAE